MPGAFAKLIDEREVSRVTLSFESTIAASFETHPMQHPTRDEVKRRFDLCAKIFERLRADAKWSIVRALDKMPEYLGAELSGIPWAPDARQCWMPEDGDPVHG